MRTTLITIAFIVSAMFCLGGCSCDIWRCGPKTLATNAAPRPARLNHLAFFKLHDPSDADELIEDCDAKLAIIPGVVSYYAGRHLDTGRTTVDGDYDVGFYVGFMSEADLAEYVAHPNHIALVEKWKPRWQWIRVHDVVDETP